MSIRKEKFAENGGKFQRDCLENPVVSPKKEREEMVLGQVDYVQGAEVLARNLVGKVLCRRTPEGEVLRRRITETECYSTHDSACHAYGGKTPRNAVMYRQGGVAYVYICYGIHHLLNVVAGAEGSPEAVLIRGVEGVYGPGRLTKAMGIDKSVNTLALTPENGLWLEDDGTEVVVQTGRRIGIGYARQEDQARLWRFFVKQDERHHRRVHGTEPDCR